VDQCAQSAADGLSLKRVAECRDASSQSDAETTYKNGSIIAAMKILEALQNGELLPHAFVFVGVSIDAVVRQISIRVMSQRCPAPLCEPVGRVIWMRRLSAPRSAAVGIIWSFTAIALCRAREFFRRSGSTTVKSIHAPWI